MKIKIFLISLSVICFLSFLLASCSQEEDMGVGGGAGTDPPRGSGSTIQINDTITDSVPSFFSND